MTDDELLHTADKILLPTSDIDGQERNCADPAR